MEKMLNTGMIKKSFPMMAHVQVEGRKRNNKEKRKMLWRGSLKVNQNQKMKVRKRKKKIRKEQRKIKRKKKSSK